MLDSPLRRQLAEEPEGRVAHAGILESTAEALRHHSVTSAFELRERRMVELFALLLRGLFISLFLRGFTLCLLSRFLLFLLFPFLVFPLFLFPFSATAKRCQKTRK